MTIYHAWWSNAIAETMAEMYNPLDPYDEMYGPPRVWLLPNGCYSNFIVREKDLSKVFRPDLFYVGSFEDKDGLRPLLSELRFDVLEHNQTIMEAIPNKTTFHHPV